MIIPLFYLLMRCFTCYFTADYAKIEKKLKKILSGMDTTTTDDENLGKRQ